MALNRITAGATLMVACGGLAWAGRVKADGMAAVVAEYRRVLEARDKLAPSSEYDRERWDTDRKLQEMRKSLRPSAEAWWKDHTEKDIAATSDDQLLVLLPTRDPMIVATADAKESAAISEAVKRAGFASIVQEWDWATLDGVKDDQLERLWSNHLPHFTFTAARNREFMLTEIIRRGGKRWEAFVQGQIELREGDLKKKDREDLWRQMGSELLLTTTLRRVQKRPDPLAVELSEASYEATFPELPAVTLALVNVDGQPVTLQLGGDYRSGRLTRWRFEVKDSKGKAMPHCEWHGMMGGGISTNRSLKPDERMKYELPPSHYIEPLAPGEYTMRVQFHNTEDIADRNDVAGLLVFESKEVKLKVKPRLLKNGAANRKQAEALIAQLPAEGPTKIVDGTYGKWAHDFVPPESAQGKLLMMGLDALPALIDQANDKGTSAVRRAAILSILYSTTGTNDPMAAGVLGLCERRQGPWTVSWGDGMGIGGIGVWSLVGNPAEVKIDAAKQLEVAARWRVWAEGIEVEADVEKGAGK